MATGTANLIFNFGIMNMNQASGDSCNFKSAFYFTKNVPTNQERVFIFYLASDYVIIGVVL